MERVKAYKLFAEIQAIVINQKDARSKARENKDENLIADLESKINAYQHTLTLVAKQFDLNFTNY